MKDTSILVLSCDKNGDLFLPFHHCMEKYWPEHPKIYYATETILNPYYETIHCNKNIDEWTDRIYKTLLLIDSKFVLIMVDDLFLQSFVNNNKMESLVEHMRPDIVNINLEPSFDNKDIPIDGTDLLKRNPEGLYLNSVMCGLWNRELMLKTLDNLNTSPWVFEFEPKLKCCNYLITRNGDYLNWGYKTDVDKSNWHFGLHRGRWEKACVEFLSHEGLQIDYSIRGIS